MIKRIVAGLLRLSLLVAVFLGSCAGSSALYLHSAKWGLDDVDLEKDRTFFGAYVEEKNDRLEVVRYEYLPEPGGPDRIRYRLPREKMTYVWEGGGSATIDAENQADGSQLVRIHAIGDTPWTSLSEYRVTGNEIHPLRHGASNHIFLIGALLSPFIAWFLQKPLGRLVDILVGAGGEESKPGSENPA